MQDASAAVAAAQLLAFCKDPVRYRPRLTHGREVPPGGVHVFRFAQGKFPNGLLRELPTQERERLRQAAVFFIRQICFWSGASHYQVLCVPPEARREAIKEHYHSLIALIHPDRQDADSEHWPPEAAHRVNLAYAVLADDARRAEYDAGLHKSVADRGPSEEDERGPPQTVGGRVPIRGWFAAARMRYRRPALLVTAAIATLFFLQTWWAGDQPKEYAVLDSATPLELSRRWVRNVFAASDRPRYLAGGVALSGPQAQLGSHAAEEEQESLLTPLWKRLSGLVAEEVPAMAPPSKVVRPPSGVAAVPARASVADAREDTGAGRSAAETESRPLRSSQDTSRPAATPPLAVGGPLSAAHAIEMEILIASMVTYYERGDLDRFLGLFDADSLGVVTAIGLRADYQRFFRETRERRLRVERISWDVKGETTRAKGTALLEVEYRDPPERLERPVALEVVMRMRDGKPRIAGLSLFPRE